MSEAEQEVGTRLQVYLAKCGVGSRRSCAALIEEGRVSVNGNVVTERGYRVRGNDDIEFDGETVLPEKTKRYLALNKPPKYLCSSHDPEGRPLAVNLLAPYFKERLYNVGRLDFMSDGLILFTNDGDFALKAGHPSSDIEKEYRIVPSDDVDREELSKNLSKAMDGLHIEDELYTISSFRIDDRIEGENSIFVTLTEGKNREIRRIFSSFDIPVKRLTRVRIGPVHLDDIPSGGYRHLEKKEVDWFLKRSGKKKQGSEQEDKGDS